jgi:hypothetical protein
MPNQLNNRNVNRPPFSQLKKNYVEDVQIEKYTGGSMIYVITSRAGQHVMCTFLFERAMFVVFLRDRCKENTGSWLLI